jgi:hypothetical protein
MKGYRDEVGARLMGELHLCKYPGERGLFMEVGVGELISFYGLPYFRGSSDRFLPLKPLFVVSGVTFLGTILPHYNVQNRRGEGRGERGEGRGGGEEVRHIGLKIVTGAFWKFRVVLSRVWLFLDVVLLSIFCRRLHYINHHYNGNPLSPSPSLPSPSPPSSLTIAIPLRPFLEISTIFSPFGSNFSDLRFLPALVTELFIPRCYGNQLGHAGFESIFP